MKYLLQKGYIILLLMSVILGYSSCAVGPVNGYIFTSNKFAGSFNPANNVKSAKTAKGCQHLILGLFAFGDAGAGAVAKKAGIQKIATIDHSTTNVFQVLYSSYCTIVSGE